MAGRGPAPKEPGKRQRRNAPPQMQELVADQYPAKAPGLGEGYRLVGSNKLTRYLAETRRWWKTWVESPQAQRFTVTDWLRLKLIARLVDQYSRDPDPRLMSEIRLNETGLGATAHDRLRLNWKVVEKAKRREDPRRTARSQRDPRLHVVK